MSDRWRPERQEVASAAREMEGRGLVTGSSGNVSMRLSPLDGATELLAITPSGVPHTGLADRDIVVTDFEIEPVDGDLTPSSESLLHAAIYRARPDVKAVIHTHSVFCSVAAVSGLEVPPILDEMVIAIGGPIKISEYALPATQELADNVCRALGERNAALIRNHGAVGVGRDLEKALNVCSLAERVTQIFFHARLLGGVNPLPQEVVDAELAIYRMQHSSEGPRPMQGRQM